MTIDSLIWNFEQPVIEYPEVLWNQTGISLGLYATSTIYRMASSGTKVIVTSPTSNKFASTTDGVNWTTTTTAASTTDLSTLTYGNSTFVGIRVSSAISKCSFDNGVTWVSGSMPSQSGWSQVKWCNDRFIAVASPYNKAAYSFDGITWVASTLPAAYAWSGIASTPNRIVVIAGTGETAYSTNGGVTWSAGPMIHDTLNTWSSIEYGAGILVSFMSNNDTRYAYSYDEGASWSIGLMPVGNGRRNVSFIEDQFIAVGTTNNSLHSYDGRNWVSHLMPSQAWTGCVKVGSKLVAMSWPNYTYTV